MSVAIRAMECFVLAVFYGILPAVIGFGLGWIMCKEKKREEFMQNVWYLKNIIIRLFIEGKISDTEKAIFDKAIDDIVKEREDG